MRPWKTPRARAGDDVADHFRRGRVRHGVVEHHRHVGVGVAGKEVDAAQREGRALALRQHVDLLAHQLAAGIHDEDDELRVLADPGVELAEMGGGFRLLLHDQPGELGAIADDDIGDRADEGVARAGLALDDDCLGAVADAHRQAHMRLAAGLDVLQLDRLGVFDAFGDVDEVAVGDEGGIHRADRVVEAARVERRREAAVGQLVGDTRDGDAFDLLVFRRRYAVQHGENCRSLEHGRDGLCLRGFVDRPAPRSVAGASRCSARTRCAWWAGRP